MLKGNKSIPCANSKQIRGFRSAMFFKYVLKMCLIFVMFLDLGLNRIHLPGFTKAWNVPESSMKGFQWSVPKHQRNNKYVADSSGDHQILMDENSWLKVVFCSLNRCPDPIFEDPLLTQMDQHNTKKSFCWILTI